MMKRILTTLTLLIGISAFATAQTQQLGNEDFSPTTGHAKVLTAEETQQAAALAERKAAALAEFRKKMQAEGRLSVAKQTDAPVKQQAVTKETNTRIQTVNRGAVPARTISELGIQPVIKTAPGAVRPAIGQREQQDRFNRAPGVQKNKD